ncbi:MAG: hypothetical protein AB1512_17505 [Thermodesulfobacteriota bacterium]
MAEVIEVTGKILFEIRDEIRQTRKDLQEEIRGVKVQVAGLDERLTHMEGDIQDIKQDLKAIHGFLQRDIMALADRVGRIERHLHLDQAA